MQINKLIETKQIENYKNILKIIYFLATKRTIWHII